MRSACCKRWCRKQAEVPCLPGIALVQIALNVVCVYGTRGPTLPVTLLNRPAVPWWKRQLDYYSKQATILIKLQTPAALNPRKYGTGMQSGAPLPPATAWPGNGGIAILYLGRRCSDLSFHCLVGGEAFSAAGWPMTRCACWISKFICYATRVSADLRAADRQWIRNKNYAADGVVTLSVNGDALAFPICNHWMINDVANDFERHRQYSSGRNGTASDDEITRRYLRDQPGWIAERCHCWAKLRLPSDDLAKASRPFRSDHLTWWEPAGHIVLFPLTLSLSVEMVAAITLWRYCVGHADFAFNPGAKRCAYGVRFYRPTRRRPPYPTRQVPVHL